MFKDWDEFIFVYSNRKEKIPCRYCEKDITRTRVRLNFSCFLILIPKCFSLINANRTADKTKVENACCPLNPKDNWMKHEDG